jgi:hypothetical protein
MYKKLALAVLIACTTASGSIITPVHADTIDAFITLNPITGVFTPEPGTVSTESATDSDSPGWGVTPGTNADEHLAMIFTEQGTGTSDTAIVSDVVFVQSVGFNLLYLSDGGTACAPGFDDLCVTLPANTDVAGIKNFFVSLSGLTAVTNFMVLEETGNPQPMSPFNSELTELFFGSDVDVPAAVPGPIVGAGLPGLILAGGVLLLLARRRRQQTA